MSPGRPEDVCIVGLGARTPLGETLAATAAAARAGVAPFGEHPWMIDRYGKPMITARDTMIASELEGAERLLALAMPALAEAMAPLTAAPQKDEKVPLFLGLPSESSASGRAKAIVDRLPREFKGPPPISEVVGFPRGHSAGLMAIEEACRRIGRGDLELAIAGGIDSYDEPETLELLDEREELKSEAHPWGFIPGEGAGFCLLTSRRRAQKSKWAPWGTLAGIATAKEDVLIRSSDGVCLGRGLTEAIRGALRSLGGAGEKVDQTWCDLNGQPYRADEFGYAVSRVSPHFVDASEFTAPADCWGDVGAASGPLLISLALVSGRKSTAKGARHLIWTSSESGERSAAILRLETTGEGT
ncbi:MAG TPA: beta-ketoacyl synthase N-terminal-like domain-containing protein [Planctomycetota bacterium]|jgi:3-oxoacyl-[acyl-carrier-protein] synthase-1|nr:beta-ketoacyl synthase N-terminal-like domain-containing protein [Planctomycetota bacterium]